MKNYLFLAVALSVVPSVAFASWWNPLTWNIFSSHQPNSSIQIISTTTLQDQTLIDNSTTTAVTIPAATTTEVVVATTSVPSITIPVKKVTPPMSIPIPPIKSQASIVSSPSPDGSTACPLGYTCTPTNQQKVISQSIPATTPCTQAENTKVLDGFLVNHPEYQPANDSNSMKWNFFRNIYKSYNPTNVCPQQLYDLLEKTQTEFEATYATPVLPPATSEQVTALMALCTASGVDCNTSLNGYNTNAIYRSNMDALIQVWQAKQQTTQTPQQQMTSCEQNLRTAEASILNMIPPGSSGYMSAQASIAQACGDTSTASYDQAQAQSAQSAQTSQQIQQLQQQIQQLQQTQQQAQLQQQLNQKPATQLKCTTQPYWDAGVLRFSTSCN